jgi:hypothetical protein
MKSRKYLFMLAGWVAVWLANQKGILMHEQQERRAGTGRDRIVRSAFAAPCRSNSRTAA